MMMLTMTRDSCTNFNCLKMPRLLELLLEKAPRQRARHCHITMRHGISETVLAAALGLPVMLVDLEWVFEL